LRAIALGWFWISGTQEKNITFALGVLGKKCLAVFARENPSTVVYDKQ
jgi:hypothetical protein